MRLIELTRPRIDKDVYMYAWIGRQKREIFEANLVSERCRYLLNSTRFDDLGFAITVADYTYVHDLIVMVKNGVDTLLHAHLDKRATCKHYETKRLFLHNDAFIAML